MHMDREETLTYKYQNTMDLLIKTGEFMNHEKERIFG